MENLNLRPFWGIVVAVSVGLLWICNLSHHLTATFLLPYTYSSKGYTNTEWVVRNQIQAVFPIYEYSFRHKRQTLWLAEGAEQEAQVVDEEEPSELEVPLMELLLKENQEAAVLQEEAPQEMITSDFTPHTQMAQIDMASLEDYETLVRNFYTVDENTSASSDRLNVHKFLEQNLQISKNTDGPQILIFHTHSQERFIDSVPGEESMTIMGVGDRLTQILTEGYGYKVLHHRGKYDVESRDDAYSEALPDIAKILEENPTIDVVIDLHRDQMPEGKKLVMDLDGRPTARFMFFNGLSRTRKTGNIEYLYNKNLDNNLAFSFQMQRKAMEYYPGLTRKIYLKGYRYNMHLKAKYLLIEMGAQNNILEEVMNACDPLAHILDLVLSGT